MLDPALITTTFALEGRRIVKNLGVVRGLTVRTLGLVGGLRTSVQIMRGGNISALADLCEKTRKEAFQLMTEHANELGANAVIGTRYDATEVAPGVTEVLAYGTAVVVERL